MDEELGEELRAAERQCASEPETSAVEAIGLPAFEQGAGTSDGIDPVATPARSEQGEAMDLAEDGQVTEDGAAVAADAAADDQPEDGGEAQAPLSKSAKRRQRRKKGLAAQAAMDVDEKPSAGADPDADAGDEPADEPVAGRRKRGRGPSVSCPHPTGPGPWRPPKGKSLGVLPVRQVAQRRAQLPAAVVRCLRLLALANSNLCSAGSRSSGSCAPTGS